jgi:hypothetical protein
MKSSNEPAASVYRADNFMASHPIFTEGNLFFALICINSYVSVCAPLKFIYGPMTLRSVLSLDFLLMCSFIQFCYLLFVGQ